MSDKAVNANDNARAFRADGGARPAEGAVPAASAASEDENAPEIKLPLLCKAIHLANMPGQRPGERCAVVWGGGLREPRDGMGYVVSLTGKRTGRVLAWLRDGGKAWRCSDLLREAPQGQPAVTLALWENDRHAGRVAVATPQGGLTQASELAVGAGNTYSFVRPTVELGMPYLAAKLPFREFLAVAFLAFCYFPQRSAAEASQVEQPAGAAGAGDKNPGSPAVLASANELGEGGTSGDALAGANPNGEPAEEEVTGTMADVLELFRELSYPDAVETLCADVRQGRRVSGFERYAARILAAADADRLRRIAARHEVSVVRLSTTRLFWTRFSADELSPDELTCLLALETALNRLVLLRRALNRAAQGTRVAEEADFLARYPEHVCAYQDLRNMRTVLRAVPDLLEGAQRENPWQRVRGAEAARGGAWDLRTRFAAACEDLALPTRFTYRFTCDADAGAFAVRLYAPPAAVLPQEAWSDEKDAWQPCATPLAAAGYGLCLAALAAAAAFGAGAGVVRAQVVGCADLACKEPLFSLTFDRLAFVGMDRALVDRALTSPASAEDLKALAARLGADKLAFSLSDAGELAPIAEPEPLVPPQPELWADNRPLPPDLADLLCADTVSDLDVFHGEDPLAPRVAEAVELSETDPVEAARRLTDVLDALAALQAASGDERPPLYCSNAVARLTVGMRGPAPGTRYLRVLDSAYDALLYLSRLCRHNNDPVHAEEYAHRCVELAPTSAQGYLDRGMCLVDLKRPREAVRGYQEALRFEASSSLYGFLYYRLAYALWAVGEKDEALACYSLVEDDPRLGIAVREERAQLMREMGADELPGPAEITRTLQHAGIAVAPSDELLTYAASTAMRLLDAGFPRAAAPLARLIAMSEHGDVLSMLATSLDA